MFKKVQESIKLKSSTLHSMNFLHEITCNFLNRNVETKKSDLKKCRTIIDLVPRLYFGVLKIPVENELISIFQEKSLCYIDYVTFQYVTYILGGLIVIV